MNPSLQIAIKEFKLLFRSKRRILWLFSTTLIIIGVGLIAGLVVLFVEDKEPSLLIAGESTEFNQNKGGALLQTLCEYYTGKNFTQIDLDEASIRNDKKDFDILVILPVNFSALLLDNSTAVNATVQVYYDGGDLTSLRFATDVELAIQHLNSLIVYEAYSIDKALWVAPDLENVAEGVGELGAAVLAMIPLYGMLLLAMPAVSLTLISVTVEREQKTLEPLLLSRIPRKSIVWGKLFYGLFLIGISLGLNFASIILGVVLYGLITGGEEQFGDLLILTEDLADFIGLDAFSILFLFSGLLIISMLLVSICVLFSFIAKDEREGQMLNSSVIGIPSILVITFLFLPFADLPFWLKIVIALIPLFGFLQSGYFVFLESKVGLTAAVGLISQLIWIVVTILATARLMESEGILEVSLSQVFSRQRLLPWKKK